ncbi:unnamed protein product [Symbiodinium sp. CCMP2456]|nr:unnamed protein product [Symbiodinium sp. CCMP2456]
MFNIMSILHIDASAEGNTDPWRADESMKEYGESPGISPVLIAGLSLLACIVPIACCFARRGPMRQSRPASKGSWGFGLPEKVEDEERGLPGNRNNLPRTFSSQYSDETTDTGGSSPHSGSWGFAGVGARKEMKVHPAPEEEQDIRNSRGDWRRSHSHPPAHGPRPEASSGSWQVPQQPAPGNWYQRQEQERQRRQREKEDHQKSQRQQTRADQDAWQHEWIKNKREQDRLEKELKHQEEEQQKRQRKEAQRRQQEEEERQRKWHEQEEQWKKQAEELRREKEKQEEQEYLRQKLQEEQRRCREQEQQRQKAEKQRQHEQQRQQQQQQQRGREQQRRDQKQEKADGERSRGGFFGRWRAKSEPAKEQSKKKGGPQASAPKGSQWTRWPGADMPRAASTEDKARSAKETEERAAREKMQKAAEHKASSLMDTVMKQIAGGPTRDVTQRKTCSLLPTCQTSDLCCEYWKFERRVARKNGSLAEAPNRGAAFFDGHLQMDGAAQGQPAYQSEGTASGEVLGTVAEVQLRGKRLAFVFLHSDGSERVRVVFDRRLFDSSSSELPFPSKSLHADTVRVEVQQTEGGKDLFGLRWFRLPQEVSAGSTPGIPEPPRGRRSSSTWVCCPLCSATSMRRFSLDRGLRAHLDAVHSEGDEPKELKEAWHRKMADMAEARGIFSHRSAEGLGGARRSAFINNQATTDDRKLSPALEAARTGDVTTLEGLLREGWQPFRAASLDKHGASALDWAAGNGHMECVDLLLTVDAGHALKATRRDGRGAFHWAAQGGHNSVLQRLLQCKVHPDARTTAGVTMMMFASYGGHIETCDFLLRQRADLWLQNAYGCDAGHFAAMGGDVAICRWLLQQGMCFTRPQRSGHTALDKAMEFEQEDVINYLARASAGVEESRRQPSQVQVRDW